MRDDSKLPILALAPGIAVPITRDSGRVIPPSRHLDNMLLNERIDQLRSMHPGYFLVSQAKFAELVVAHCVEVSLHRQEAGMILAAGDHFDFN